MSNYTFILLMRGSFGVAENNKDNIIDGFYKYIYSKRDLYNISNYFFSI